MSSHRWGELRACLESESLDARALSDILTPWHEDAPEELFEIVLPYVFDHMRQRDEQRVVPRSSAPYSPWIDELLQRAFDLDEERADPRRVTRAYRNVLEIKPDCIPARVNLYRVTHRGYTLPELLDAHPWEVSAPDEESTRLVRSALLTIDWVGRLMDIEDEHELFDTFNLIARHLFHARAPCSMAVMVVQSVLLTLDHDMAAPIHIEMTARLLLSMLLRHMFEPYTRDDLERRSGGEQSDTFIWPVERLWSFTDPITLEFESQLDMSRALPESEERLHVEQRGYALYLIGEPRHRGPSSPCHLPFFPPWVFERDGWHLIDQAIRQVVCQMIAAGLPVYRRLLARHGREEVEALEALMWHLGHMAAREQADLRTRLDAHELRALSTMI